MSTNQVKQCLIDILGLNGRESSVNWEQGHLKTLTGTTMRLYNVSLQKVMLKQSEEIARCHICAYLAAEKMSEKYDPDLNYYSEKVPLEPRVFQKTVGIFKQCLWQSSPLKQLQFTPSPRKVNRAMAMESPTKGQAFETPSKQSNRRSAAMPPPSSTRRKLAFEDDQDDDYMESPTKTPRRYMFKGRVEPDPEESDFESPVKSPSKSPSKSVSPRKKRGEYNQWNMLFKKYYRIPPEEVIALCNHFELPAKVAFLILDCFSMHATYLVYPAQLVCGLIILCCFVIFNRARANCPSIDSYLLEKMCVLMRSSDTNDVLEAIKITRELLDGEKWYRDLKVEYDYYDGADFENSLAVRLGNMLQNSNVIASDEQFAEWKKKALMDIALRDGV